MDFSGTYEALENTWDCDFSMETGSCILLDGAEVVIFWVTDNKDMVVILAGPVVVILFVVSFPGL